MTWTRLSAPTAHVAGSAEGRILQRTRHATTRKGLILLPAVMHAKAIWAERCHRNLANHRAGMPDAPGDHQRSVQGPRVPAVRTGHHRHREVVQRTPPTAIPFPRHRPKVADRGSEMSSEHLPSGYDVLRRRRGQLMLIDQHGERIHVRTVDTRAKPGRLDQRRSAPQEGIHHNEVTQMLSWRGVCPPQVADRRVIRKSGCHQHRPYKSRGTTGPPTMSPKRGIGAASVRCDKTRHLSVRKTAFEHARHDSLGGPCLVVGVVRDSTG